MLYYFLNYVKFNSSQTVSILFSHIVIRRLADHSGSDRLFQFREWYNRIDAN